MKLIFLGTGAAVPTLKRNVTSVVLRFEDTGRYWLFDCGEGTQHQLKKASFRLSKLEKVFISHFHGDHVFGLPGMLSTRGLEGIKERVDIYGPKGIKSFIEGNRKTVNFHLTYELGINNFPKKDMGVVYEDNKFIVRSALLNHSVSAYGFSVKRKPRYRFLMEKARKCGVPEGPLFGELKEGKAIKLKDGRRLNGRDFVEKVDDGKKLVYCSDTAYCESSVELAKNADVLIHEATFSGKEQELADKSLHSSVGDACRVATEAGVSRLILTHFSPRYDTKIRDGTVYTMENMADEAKALFPETLMAKDFMEYEIK